MWSQFPPNLSCLQNNLLENNVGPVPAEFELPPKQFAENNVEPVLEEIARTCSDTRIPPLLTLVLTGPNGQIGGLGVTAFY